MKTRTNQPVDEIVVGNIKQLTGEQIDNLECGDIVCKEDETGKHSYVVTFKKDRVGICLTYGDGSGYIETVSYDYTGGAWVYNSTDVYQGSQKLNIADFKLENIKDAQGHNRFIEGDIDAETITGMTKYYGKWALSGTHLLIVFAANLANGSSINYKTIAKLKNVPEWILDKIYTLFSNIAVISNPNAYNSAGGTQTFPCQLRKVDGELTIYKTGDLTLTDDRFVRIEFGLLIDDEQGE